MKQNDLVIYMSRQAVISNAFQQQQILNNHNLSSNLIMRKFKASCHGKYIFSEYINPKCLTNEVWLNSWRHLKDQIFRKHVVGHRPFSKHPQ